MRTAKNAVLDGYAVASPPQTTALGVREDSSINIYAAIDIWLRN